ncbi:ribokinase [Arthrobacter stackebrandtii]|nr:PfkB family carbohydrate kinase [Arthrobacter stackebrandtii]PYG99736.1 ribokinase [Arthrobacter stackebrandtii]
MQTLLTVGDNLVDCYPDLGLEFPGGNCLNVAIQAARTGMTVSYLGAVGTDARGDLIRATLQEENVSFERGRIIDGPSAYCIIGHQDGDRVFLDSNVGVSRFQLSEGDIAFAARHTIVHSAQQSGTDEFIGALAEQTLVSYDFSTISDEKFIREIGKYCFLASFSGGNLDDSEVEELVDLALTSGSQWVLVTRGSNGAILRSAKESFSVAPVPVETLDTLGAGDTFVATVLSGLVAGTQPQDFLQEAARRAAETCTHFGGVGHGAPSILHQRVT